MKVLVFTTKSGKPCAIRADIIQHVEPGAEWGVPHGYAGPGQSAIMANGQRFDVQEPADVVIAAWVKAMEDAT